MSKTIKVSCIQYTSEESECKTLPKVLKLIQRACTNNPDLITLPECATFIGRDKIQTSENAHFENESLALSEISKLSKKYKVNILIGSLQTKIFLKNKKNNSLVNRSFLINTSGKIVDRYDKIHMFDVNLSNGKRFKESETYLAGNDAVLSQLRIRSHKVKIGMTICYDLRFPKLYTDLAKAGADILTIPSAFTKFTGKSHWHTLLKSRAIENGCFVVAPAQVGKHFLGRESFGHSLIISPWGEVLADGKNKETIISSVIDLNEVRLARKMLPNLKKEKFYKMRIKSH